MKKVLRYCGMVMLGLLVPIIIITSVIRYYDVGVGDIFTHTEKILNAVIRLWDTQQEINTTTGNDISKNLYNGQFSKKMAHLYFSDLTDRYLKVEDRVVSHPNSPGQYAQILMAALFDGPGSNLNQVLPKGDYLRAVYICNENHTAYVDLKQTIVSHFPGGVTQELLTVYAIVNTLTLNLQDIEQVKIIIGGQETNTLAGHIDIRYPFTTNMLIVR